MKTTAYTDFLHLLPLAQLQALPRAGRQEIFADLALAFSLGLEGKEQKESIARRIAVYWDSQTPEETAATKKQARQESTFAYVRVSTQEQNPARQIQALENYYPELRPENIYTDRQSGADFQRPAYQALTDTLQRGDTLLVAELDRLGRHRDRLLEELDALHGREIFVRFLDVPTTLMEFPQESLWIYELMNSMMIDLLSAMAEQERRKIRQRQAQGIALARAQGKYKGRAQNPLPPNFGRLYDNWRQGGITAVEFTRLLGYKSRTSTYRLIQRYEEENNIQREEKE